MLKPATQPAASSKMNPRPRFPAVGPHENDLFDKKTSRQRPLCAHFRAFEALSVLWKIFAENILAPAHERAARPHRDTTRSIIANPSANGSTPHWAHARAFYHEGILHRCRADCRPPQATTHPFNETPSLNPFRILRIRKERGGGHHAR